MARCCGGGTCACLIEAGPFIGIEGTGSSQNPFVVSADLDLDVQDNSVFNLTLTGAGTTSSPWTLAVGFAATAKLDDIPDVNAPTPSNGDVLSWDNGASEWVPAAPTTAPTGAVTTDASLDGDGSVGDPLEVRENTDRYLGTTVDGLGLNDAGINQMVRKFGDATDRSLADPAPDLNTVSILDDNPGQMDYWNGVSWEPTTNGIALDSDSEFLSMSGPYGGGPTTVIIRQISAITDASGVFEMLTSTDLSGAGGVLSVMFQETGSLGYRAVAVANVNEVLGTAYRLTDGAVYASQAITGIVTAFIY